MKNLQITLVFALLILSACVVTRQNQVFLGGWNDTQYDFFETIEHNSSGDYLSEITLIKWAGNTFEMQNEYQWIRKPENMIMFFNTIKYIGFERVISQEQYNEKLFEDDYWDFDWEGKSLNDICKTLISCYKDTTGYEEYYKNFWVRREKENNDKILYEIFKELDRSYNSNVEHMQQDLVDYDTVLFNLLSFDINLNNADSIEKQSIIINYFDYLIDKDLNHSAYNLVFEIREYQDIQINRDSLLSVLQPDTIVEKLYWKIRNDANWIKSYKDNGP